MLKTKKPRRFLADQRKKYEQLRLRSRGFTIIELMVATAVFSIVLIVILAAFIQISRIYYKGVSMNNTQEDTRTITQDISDDIKYTQNAPIGFTATANAPGKGYFCIGLHRYKYQIGHQLGTPGGLGDYGIVRDTISTATGCPSPALVTGSNPDELLDNGMQLNALAVNCAIARCLVNTHVVFFGGDHDVFFTSNSAYSGNPWLAPDAQCTGAINSSQFCAVADYNRTVLQRT